MDAALLTSVADRIYDHAPQQNVIRSRRLYTIVTALVITARVFAAFILLAGCKATGTGSSGAENKDQASEPAAGTWSDQEAWRLREDLRIGGDREGRDDFDAVWDVTADPAGRIYVLLTRQAQIRVFGPDGSYIRTIGRLGSGPGELRAPRTFAWDSSGRLWVTDAGNGRYVIFDTTGRAVGSQSRPIRFDCRPAACGWFVGGRHVDGGIVPVAPSVFQNRLVVVDSSGAIQQELRLPLPDSTPRTSPRPIPFAPRTIFTVSADGTIWVGVNRDYTVRAMTLDGRTVRTVKGHATPIPVSPGDLANARESFRQLGIRAGFDGVADEVAPAVKPAFAQLIADTTGHLWVATAERDDGISTGFDIFDNAGQYLGRTRGNVRIDVTPLGAPAMDPGPVRVIGDYVYATTHDAAGRPSVVRIKILRPSR